MALSKDSRDKLAALAGVTDPNASEDAIVKRLLQGHATIKEKVQKIVAQRDAALSRAAAAEEGHEKPTALVLSSVGSAMAAYREDAIKKGKVNAHTAAELDKLWTEGGHPNDLACSLSAGSEDARGVAFWKIMADAPAAPPLGAAEIERLQNPNDAAAARATPPVVSEERRKELVELAMHRRDYIPQR